MNMTPEAIVRDYKEAKEPKAQIQSLADMNLCEKREIEKILSDNGCKLPSKPASKKTSVEPEDSGECPKEKPHKSREALCQVPGIVREVVNTQMVRLQQVIDACQEKIREYEKELEELSSFLKNSQ